MKLKLEIELDEVYGGDGVTRYEPREKVTLTRARTKTMIRDSIGIAVPVKTEEEVKEKRLEPVATFRFDEAGNPTLRLGGAHGKLWGALKSSAKQLFDLGDPDFRKAYKAAVDMINITPVWTRLNADGDMRVEGIPQVLKGTNGGMIIQYFDVIPKARARVEVLFPDALETKVVKLMNQLEVGTHLNKRRSTIRVISFEKVA